MADTAVHQQPVPEQIPAPIATESTRTEAPSRTTSWSDVAAQCWSGGFSDCAKSFGEKLGSIFSTSGEQASSELQTKKLLPKVELRADSAERRESPDAPPLPLALQGENRKRTETLLNAKAEPQDRIKAASELLANGVSGFTIQSADGTQHKVRLEKLPVTSDRSMLGVYISKKNGGELNALRAIDTGNGTLANQVNEKGKSVDFKGRGAALLDRVSDGSTVVDAGTSIKGDRKTERKTDLKDDRPPSEIKTDRKDGLRPGEVKTERKVEPPAESVPAGEKKVAREGEWKSPFARKYEAGDKFKGVSSVYWEDLNTASGVRFRKDELTAASREFPFGTVLNVRNPATGLETKVVITDHGPFAGPMKSRPDGSGRVHERVLDISAGAARAIGMGRTVKELEISVDSIPNGAGWGTYGGKWGSERRNLNSNGKRELLSLVDEVTRKGRT